MLRLEEELPQHRRWRTWHTWSQSPRISKAADKRYHRKCGDETNQDRQDHGFGDVDTRGGKFFREMSCGINCAIAKHAIRWAHKKPKARSPTRKRYSVVPHKRVVRKSPIMTSENGDEDDKKTQNTPIAYYQPEGSALKYRWKSQSTWFWWEVPKQLKVQAQAVPHWGDTLAIALGYKSHSRTTQGPVIELLE